MIVHLVLFVLMSFVFVGAARVDRADEPDRPAGIVLAQKTDQLTREYFDEIVSTDPTDQADASPDADRASEAITPSESPPESYVVADLALPNSADIPLAGLAFADRPRLTVSGRRPKVPGIDESAIITDAQARFRAANARGPVTKLGIFGSKEAVGGSFVFLIDRSKSMGGEGLGVLQDAEKELVRVLKRLEPVHRFQVVVYHNKCIYMKERELLPATDENKAAVGDFLASKAAFGATEHALALMSVLRLEPDVIFLLTDGGEPELKEHELRAISALAGERTSVHCLHFGSRSAPDPNSFLRRLAAATGGEYGYIDVTQKQ